jgi:hypothetical protein
LKLLDAWNAKVVAAGHVAAQAVDAPRRYDRYRYPDSAWPQSFIQDVAAWESFRQDRDQPLHPVGSVTAKNEGRLIIAMASAFCRKTGALPSQVNSISTITSIRAAPEIIQYMLDRQNRTRSTPRNKSDGAYAAARLLVKLGRFWVGLSTRGVGALAIEASNLRTRGKVPLSRKTTMVMKGFSGVDAAKELLNLPYRIYRDLPLHRPLTHREAALYTAAFALSFSMNVPLAPAQLARLRLDDHIHSASDEVTVVWGGNGKRGDRKLAYPLAGKSLRIFQLYRDHVRPRHPESTGPYLIPGRRGPRVPSSISRQIATLVETHCGIRVTAQQLQYVWATIFHMQSSMAVDAAAQRDVRRYLGQAAFRWYDPLLEEVKNLRAGGRVDRAMQ